MNVQSPAIGIRQFPDLGADIASRIAEGHVRTVSRCISFIENGHPALRPLLEGFSGKSGKALVVGVTGVPGAGKSTLVPALARNFAGQGSKVAILAVDPSSPLTGGAILGDRIRDTALGDTKIFFRSVASRGSIGGLSRALDDIVTLLDGAGFDVILIETVGTGQSEIAVTRLAHTTLMVTAPGLGDEIQAMKAGILEVADIIVINKADSDPRGAETTALTLRQALAETLRAHGLKEGANPGNGESRPAWLAPVRAISALKGDGIADLAQLIAAHRTFLSDNQELARWRERRLLERFREATREALFEHMLGSCGSDFEAVSAAVSAGSLTPLRAAEQIANRAIGMKSTNETGRIK